MHDERKDSIKVSQPILLFILSFSIMVGGWVWGASNLQAKVEQTVTGQRNIWDKLKVQEAELNDHDKEIAVIDSKLDSLKNGQDTLQTDIKRIMRALKV